MRGRVFLRSFAIFGGAFLAAKGLLLLPREPGAWLLASGALVMGGGMQYAATEENALAQVLAGFGAATLLSALLLWSLGL
ncbi:MAG: hypothetical protein GXO66_07840 [Euryarchaeota archaeon]|nr:hypothetical protein [Euryarchaeota archaeon]